MSWSYVSNHVQAAVIAAEESGLKKEKKLDFALEYFMAKTGGLEKFKKDPTFLEKLKALIEGIVAFENYIQKIRQDNINNPPNYKK